MVQKTVAIAAVFVLLCAARAYSAFCPATEPSSAVTQRSLDWCWAANLQYLSQGFYGGCQTLQCEFVNYFRDLQLLPGGTCCVINHCDSYSVTPAEYEAGMKSFGFSIGTFVNPPAPAALKEIVCDYSRRLLAIFGDPPSISSGHAGTIVAMDTAGVSGSSLVKVMNSLTGVHANVRYDDLMAGTGAMPFPWHGNWIVYGVSCANPVAFVNDFRYEDGRAQWTVLHEWGTKEYVIEGVDSPEGDGVSLVVVSSGSSEHSVSVSTDGFSWLRLVEVEESGLRREMGLCSTKPSKRRGSGGVRNETIAWRREEIAADARGVMATQSSSASTVEHPTCVVYAMPTLVPVLQTEFADYWNARGHSVRIEATPLLPDDDSARNWVRASIRSFCDNEGVQVFHIVSDWTDDFGSPLWTYSPYWQSKFDWYSQRTWFPSAPPDNSFRVPPFLLDDAVREEFNTARFHPYVYSDRPYADVDDDGRPDVVVTRWPLSDPVDVAVACENMQMHRDNAEPLFAWSRHVTLLGNDEIGTGAAPTAAIPPMVQELAATVNQNWAGTEVSQIFRSEAVSSGEANAAVLEDFNLQMPDLVVILAADSYVSKPGGFLLKAGSPGYDTFWDMNEVTPGWLVSAVVATSCHTSLWVHFDTEEMRQAFRDFITVPDRGAAAWIGPLSSGYQNEHFLVAKSVVEELGASPFRSTAESWLRAMRSAYENPGDPLSLDAYAFLGDPISTFQRGPECSIEARVRKAGSLFMLSNDQHVALGCPQGDLDDLVILIEVDAEAIGTGLAAEEVVIRQPTSPHIALFSDETELYADETPTVTGGTYHATVTIESFSGCGDFSVPVEVRGIPLGYVKVRVKSPDMQPLPTETTRGEVTVGDVAKFGSHYPSSVCNCVHANTYWSGADFVPADTTVTNGDWAFFGAHYGHKFLPSGAAVVAASGSSSQGTLRVDVEEEQPLIGQHKVRATIVLENMEPFSTAVIALRNENELLSFTGWTSDPSLDGLALCSDIVRDGTRQVFIGVLPSGVTSTGEMAIGTAEFTVASSEPLNLTEDDFELVVGDILAGPTTISTSASQQQLSLVDRRLTVAAPSYRNELAQNYPNPFNPTTTVAFSLANDVNVDLRIYDVRGAAVKTLANERFQAGVHRLA